MGKPEQLSNAQCLRVIGQVLDAEPVRSFRLRTHGHSFIVSSDELRRAPVRGLLARISRLFRGEEEPASDYVIFNRPEIHRLDVTRQAERRPESVIDRRDVSFALRVLGDFFDRKQVSDFAIDWSENSIIARYGTRQESFTHADLYNFGVKMYLRRSNRRR
jgi:hypothetical protein